MNLSRRAKLERETPGRPAPRKFTPEPVPEPVVEQPVAAPEAAIPPPVAPPAPPVEEEVPKRVRFVRPVGEKKAASAAAAPLAPRSTKPAGKLMSKGMAALPGGSGGTGPQKGPPGGRKAIANTPKR